MKMDSISALIHSLKEFLVVVSLSIELRYKLGCLGYVDGT